MPSERFSDTVYLTSRRGVWLLWYLRGWLPTFLMKTGSLLDRFTRFVCKPSWIESEFLYFSDCTRTADNGCIMCNVSQGFGDSQRHRDVHMMRLIVDGRPDASGCPIDRVRLLVDESFDKEHAWLFVELPNIRSCDMDAFACSMIDRHHNRQGVERNFIYVGSNCRTTRSKGIHHYSELDDAQSVFCSEMATAFIQKQGYVLDLVPCETTAQMLLSELLHRYPHLSHLQVAIAPRDPRKNEVDDPFMNRQAPSEFYKSLFKQQDRPIPSS